MLAFYGRALDRPFTSEDFLLIRYLGENPPWRDLWGQLSQPGCGISVVKFFRPVSTLLYGAEIAAFGGEPFGYNLAHGLVHALNAVLVWAIVRRLDRSPLTPLAAALLFAVYPLHPNAVIFSASFATIFGAAFFLAAVLAYQGFRESGSLGAWGASMAFFLLALGSYEAAAVLPGVLAAYDHLIGGLRRPHGLCRGISALLRHPRALSRGPAVDFRRDDRRLRGVQPAASGAADPADGRGSARFGPPAPSPPLRPGAGRLGRRPLLRLAGGGAGRLLARPPQELEE